MQPLFLISTSLLLATTTLYSSTGARSITVPTVKLDAAVVMGVNVQLEPNSTVMEQFLGIPFAQPPYATCFA